MVDVLGTQLGRYEIRERLGRGGMAAVYKAWDTSLDRWVAVKVLHDYLADEADFKTRFEREAKLAASLEHANIVHVYDFDVVERSGTPLYYMVMAHIAGPSLKSVMAGRRAASQPMSLAEIANVMRGICSALSYAHRRGMVHRDVTPGNILFNEQEQAVLADFGIARIVTAARLTQSGMAVGTPMYMAPEQGVGEGGDHRSDIYSLGVILYEMLAGQVPYTGDTAVSIMLKHLNEPIPPLPVRSDGTASSLEPVVVRAMAKDPEDRYQDANALLADFERAASGQLTTVVPAREATLVLPPLARQKGSQQWLAVLVIGLVLMVVLAGLAAFGRQPVPATTSTQTPGPVETSAPVALLNPPTPLHNETFAPSMTSGPLIFKDTFGSDRGELIWPITTVDPQIYRNIEDGVYHIRHTIPTTALPTLFDEEHQYSSPFQYEADLTISEQSQDDAAAGIIFRYLSDDQYYVFAINGQGQVSIWERARGRWTELRNQPVNWTPAEGAEPKGQMNRLKLVDNNDRLQGYVNGNLVIDIESAVLVRSGAIGIYLATTSSQKVQNPLAEVSVDYFSADYYAPSTPAATQAATVATP